MNLGFIMNVVSCNENGINEIVRSYENGEIIGFPTDTVYGIGCDPFKKDSNICNIPLDKYGAMKCLDRNLIQDNTIVEFSYDNNKPEELVKQLNKNPYHISIY